MPLAVHSCKIRGITVVNIKDLRVKASQWLSPRLMLSLSLACSCNSLTIMQAALAQTHSSTAAGKTAVVKASPGKGASAAVKIEEPLAAGTLMGHPFNVVKATYTGNSIALDGGDAVAGDPSKGRTKIVIEFAGPQVFSNQTYHIRYNAKQALMADSQTKAPTVTYVAQDKSGAVASTTATNDSKSDNLDYVMELKFKPLTKKGELPGFIRLQIGSDPVSDVKGSFSATH